MILHIANDFAGSKVYKNLVKNLDDLGVNQVVYTPLRSSSLVGKNSVNFNILNSKIIYSNILDKIFDRVFYFRKIKKIVQDIESKVNMNEVTCIHAHTWYSDGGVAYKLSIKYNIPYIVTIRSTDTKIFYKYFFHLKDYGKKILNKASNIFLINKNFNEELNSISSALIGKSVFVPNGVDQFWIDNFEKSKNCHFSDCLNLIYVGNIIPRKKLLNLLKAIIKFNQFNQNKKVKLEIVGSGTGKYFNKALKLIQCHKEYFVFTGQIDDKLQLKERYLKNDIFILPSVNETFGLVYIEALLNMLPIVYVENEGIDGIYDEKIGYKLKSNSVEEIVDLIEYIFKSNSKIIIPSDKLVINHSWKRIAEFCLTKYYL